MNGTRRTIQTLALVVLSLTLNGCAAAATLQPGCTLPTLSNAGTCGAFVSGEALSAPVVPHFRWYNADNAAIQWQDSLAASAPGSTVQLSPRQVPAGRYWIVSWASWFAGVGCPDSVLVVKGAAPAKVAAIGG